MKIKNSFILPLLSLALLTAGCESIVYQSNSQQGGSQQSGFKMNSVQAERQLQDSIDTSWSSRNGFVTNLKITREGFQYYDTVYNINEVFVYKFKDLNYVSVCLDGGNTRMYFLKEQNTKNDFGRLFWRDIPNASRCADAINVLIDDAKGLKSQSREADFESFKEKVRQWRESATPPSLPEEVAQQKVLAENAVQEKNFEKAAEHYEQGLEVYPYWS